MFRIVDTLNKTKDNTLPINEQIRAAQLQVITETGENKGLMSRDQALSLAREIGLDLVMVAEQGKDGNPVAKIIDYGKVLYAKKKKISESKKHQKLVQIKEIKLRPKIGEHDYMTKIKQAVQFLKAGKFVKVTLVFRGREMATIRQRGLEMFDKVRATLESHGITNLIEEKESKAGPQWSKVYAVKK